MADHRPLDHVVALAVAVQPRLLVHAVLLHEGVVLGENLLGLAPGCNIRTVLSCASQMMPKASTSSCGALPST